MFTVYLVDDDPLILDDISSRNMWNDNYFEIVGKNTSSLNALKEICELNPHVVICDMKMPELDGVEMIKELKKRSVESEYVMLSTYASFDYSRNFFLQQGFDYLLKPLNETELQLTLDRLARKLFAKHKISENESDGQESNDVANEITRYINRNFTKKITLDHLADKFHLNSNYICGIIAKHNNQTLTVLLTNLRMQEAAKLLKNTDKPIKEVAYDCGYSSYFYFCRVFKEFFGKAPGEYASTVK